MSRWKPTRYHLRRRTSHLRRPDRLSAEQFAKVLIMIVIIGIDMSSIVSISQGRIGYYDTTEVL